MRKTACIGDGRFCRLNGRRAISLNGTRVANIEANEVVFSFEGYYTQLDRIRAWRGTLPDNGDRVFNDPDGPPITGFRVR